MSYNIADYVAHERKLQQVKLKETHTFLKTELDMLVKKRIEAFIDNDRLHDCSYVMIVDIVEALSKKSHLTHAQIRRFCYIDPDDITLFKKAEITESIIWAVKHIYATRGVSLHDVSDREKSRKIVLQLVLRPNACPISKAPDTTTKKRKHTASSHHSHC